MKMVYILTGHTIFTPRATDFHKKMIQGKHASFSDIPLPAIRSQSSLLQSDLLPESRIFILRTLRHTFYRTYEKLVHRLS